MGVRIRFECGREDRIGPTVGPFEFVQVTYCTLRDEEGDRDIAYYGKDGDWHYGDDHFSDFVIFADDGK